jgi:predicted dehydrogenase
MVGLGGIGQRHVRNLRTVLGVDVAIDAYRVRGEATTLSDGLTVVPGENVAAAHNINVFGDLHDALAEGPDAVFICNPSSLHVPVALEAARAGSAIFVEKPLSNSMDGVGELLALVEQHRLVGMVGYQMRFHPALLRTEALLRSGAIGNVIAVRVQVGEYLPGWHGYEDYRRMYAARAELGGGVVLSQIHELDYVCWLFGMPRRLLAIGGHLSRLSVDVEDTASILMECEVGGSPVPVHVQMDFLQRPPSRTCEVIGDSGKIVTNLLEPSVTAFDANGEIVDSYVQPDFQRNQLFLDELQHFLDCVAGLDSPRVSLREASRSLAIALAAKESMQSGSVIEPGGARV